MAKFIKSGKVGMYPIHKENVLETIFVMYEEALEGWNKVNESTNLRYRSDDPVTEMILNNILEAE